MKIAFGGSPTRRFPYSLAIVDEPVCDLSDLRLGRVKGSKPREE